MNKMKMAHDWAMKRLEDPDYVVPMDEFAAEAWRYVDAMQVEADKRINKERPEVLCEVDWRLAPEWANWWSVDENGTANFSGKKPHIEGHQWVYYSAAGEKPSHIEAPSFNYQGNWQNSLRKRPQ